MLGNFTYSNPTKLYFGKESLNGLNEELPKYGKNVLLVYGGGSIKKTGLYDEVIKSPEFSELENDEEAKIITETVKRNDLDGEPYETQEKITVTEEEINTKQTNNNTDYENMKVTDLRGIVKELNSHLTWNQVKAMNKKKLVETLKKNKREK